MKINTNIALARVHVTTKLKDKKGGTYRLNGPHRSFR